MKKISLGILGLFIGLPVMATVLDNLKISPNDKAKINSSAVLEISSTTQGVLFPRLTTAQRTAISSPADGLLVFDTDFDTVLVYIASTTSWNYLATGSSSVGGLTADRALYSNPSGQVAASTTTSVELGYLSGVTSAIQTQLNGKEPSFTTLSVAKGGTNSSSALNNNRFVVASSSSIRELAAQTGDRVLVTDVNGLPLASTTATSKLNILSTLTTKGDLYVHNGTNVTRLAKGTDNYVLVASSSATEGVAWAASGAAASGALQSWAGYHSSDCSWAYSNTSYVDTDSSAYVADGSCTFTEYQNTSFGTVSSFGSKNPGIQFTATSAGTYNVCANIAFTGSIPGSNAAIEMRDTNQTISALNYVPPGAGAIDESITLCGHAEVASTNSTNIYLRTKASSGTATINGTGIERAINWTIFKLD